MDQQAPQQGRSLRRGCWGGEIQCLCCCTTQHGRHRSSLACCQTPGAVRDRPHGKGATRSHLRFRVLLFVRAVSEIRQDDDQHETAIAFSGRRISLSTPPANGIIPSRWLCKPHRAGTCRRIHRIPAPEFAESGRTPFEADLPRKTSPGNSTFRQRLPHDQRQLRPSKFESVPESLWILGHPSPSKRKILEGISSWRRPLSTTGLGSEHRPGGDGRGIRDAGGWRPCS